MHGFGPRILHALPREGRGLTSREIQAAAADGLGRRPDIGTVRLHLNRLNRLGLVYSEKRRYWRLADSVFDAPLAEAEA